ncbi:MAG TPA: hypothetical protein DDW52_01235, partial [Planctomycetaceae bacterium]|nr:hypothetical protein [Planctomycetaceae bacterium]
MAQKRQKNTPQSPTSATVATAIVVLVFALYWLLFLSQPSLFGLLDQTGQPVRRSVDLFWISANAAGLLVDGAAADAIYDRLGVLVAVAAWFGLSFWVGRPIVAAASLKVSRPEYVSACILVGLSLLSTLTLVVGVCGGLASRVFLLGGAAVLAIAAWLARFLWGGGDVQFAEIYDPKGALPSEEPSSTLGAWTVRLISVCTVALAVFYVLCAVLPPWEFDVLEYHSGAPKDFWQAGRIGFSENNIYANMPLAAEMHALAAMTLCGGEDGWWWGAIFGKTVTGCFSLLAALLLFGLASRNAPRWIAWSVAGLFLALPGNLHSSSTGLVDIVVGSYLFASVWVLLVDSSGSALSRVFLSALLAGACAATKYTGLLLAVVPVASYWGWQLAVSRGRQGQSEALWKFAALGGLGLLLTVVPWYAKNWAFTGNPVYPLASSIFGADSGDAMDRWQLAHRPGGTAGKAPFAPGQAISDLGQVVWKSPYINPSLYLFAVFAVGAAAFQRFRGRKILPESDFVRIAALSVIVAWILAIWWLGTHRIDRFWFPMLPALAALAASGLAWWARRVRCEFLAVMVLLGMVWGGSVGAGGGGPNDVRIMTPLRVFYENLEAPNDSAVISRTIAWCN